MCVQLVGCGAFFFVVLVLVGISNFEKTETSIFSIVLPGFLWCPLCLF